MLRRGRRRCFDNDGTLLPFNASLEIKTQLDALVTRYPPAVSTFAADKTLRGTGKVAEPDLQGLYSGPTSIAYGLSLFDDEIKGRPALDWAEDYLRVSEAYKRDQVSTVGVAAENFARLAVTAVIRGTPEAVNELLSLAAQITYDVDNEWIAGRAGLLYLMRLIRVRRPEFAEIIQPAEERVVEDIMRHGPPSKQIWPFRGTLYIGLSHGWMGIITQVLLTDPSKFTQLKPLLLSLIEQQKKNGNWFVYNNDKRHRDIPGHDAPFYQISHGAPGMLVCLMSLRDKVDEETRVKIDRAVESAQDAIWEYGHLTKESCLLHGAAGNSLVLLDPMQRETFLAYSQIDRLDSGIKDGSLEASEPRSGLLKGIVGRVWAMKEFQKGRNGVLAGFNDA